MRGIHLKVKLSERVRPDCEAAPWVIEEIKDLESQLDTNKPAVAWLLTRADGKDQMVTSLRESVEAWQAVGWRAQELVIR